jgi:hypothetical protein
MRQGSFCFYQLQCEVPVPAAYGVVQRIASTLVLLQDRLAQLLITATPEQNRSYGDTAAGHGGK